MGIGFVLVLVVMDVIYGYAGSKGAFSNRRTLKGGGNTKPMHVVATLVPLPLLSI